MLFFSIFNPIKILRFWTFINVHFLKTGLRFENEKSEKIDLEHNALIFVFS